MVQPGARQQSASTKKARSRSAILAAAASLFEQQGWLPTTLSQIADRAGVGTATVYNHFANKNVIAGHVFRSAINDVLHDSRWSDDSRRASEVLTELIRELSLTYRENTALTVCLLEAVNDSTARNGARIDENDPRYWVPLPALFVRVIQRGQEDQEFYQYPPALEAGPLLSNLLLLRVLTRPNETASETSTLISTITARIFGYAHG